MARAGLTQMSSGDAAVSVFPPLLWFSCHLLCFEHFLLSSSEKPARARIYNDRLSDAVNI
jgi:hypothetical protein